jgi:hypothetical protein
MSLVEQRAAHRVGVELGAAHMQRHARGCDARVGGGHGLYELLEQAGAVRREAGSAMQVAHDVIRRVDAVVPLMCQRRADVSVLRPPSEAPGGRMARADLRRTK